MTLGFMALGETFSTNGIGIFPTTPLSYAIDSQVAENGSVMLAQFSNTYKCTKIQSYLLVN